MSSFIICKTDIEILVSDPRNRALRLSMIHSAQVFSPQPSKDPRENLRILQSPLKNSFKSPVKATLKEEDDIILVQGSHPRVVQDERDLVILEDVAVTAPPPSPSKLPASANLEPPQTPPRRRSLGGNTLHRAVLIRSAQRAVLKAEKEREEEEEEMEVLGAVVSSDDRDEYEDDEREDIEMDSPTEENEDDSLEEAKVVDDGITLLSFLTPQAKPGPLSLGNHAADVRSVAGRFSLGGGEAKRVVVQQPWRVKDLVIPPIAAPSSSATRSPEKVVDSPAMTARNPNHDVTASPSRPRTPMRTPARPTLTEEERKAIQERRRSALKESGPFFLGGAPGLSPVKSKSSSSSSSSSPMKGLTIYEDDGEMKDKSGEEEEEDARSLLDRMKETVDEMRRRRSVASRITTPHAEGLSPRPLFAPVTPNVRRPLFQPELHEVVDSLEDDSNEVREQEPFSLLRPGKHDEVAPPATPKSEEGSIPLPPIVVADVKDTIKSEDSKEIQERPTRAKARFLRAPKSIDVAAGPSESAVSHSQKHSMSLRTIAHTKKKVKTKALPVKQSQKADLSVQDGEHVDSKDGGSLKSIATPATAKRGRPRKVVQETLDREESTPPPVPVIPKASTKKKRTTPSGSNDSTTDQEESTPPPVPVIAKASTKKKRTPPNGSNDSTTKVRGTRKAVAAVQNSGNDDEEKDKENAVSGDVEDRDQMQAQGVTLKVRVSRSRGATGGERVEGTTTGKTKTGSGRATRSASKAVRVEVVEETVPEPVRMRTRAKSRSRTG